ncbi:hypothetical protein [Erythrobacter phage vB_EliS-L02]|nr:hypothetical protein [Erythrobacter phage vB_EliS-L02]
MPEERILFLDIDGPMIPASYYLVDRSCSHYRRFPETQIALLNELCERSGAKIVFNTTHNQEWEWAPPIHHALQAHGLKREHIRETNFKTRYPSLPRDLAVAEWLAENNPDADWLALDDVRFTDDDRLIWVDADTGITLVHLNEIADRWSLKPWIVLI